MHLSLGDFPPTYSRLNLITTGSNPFALTIEGTSTTAYNGIGYRPQDSYIYGIRTEGGTPGDSPNLMRIGSNGATQMLNIPLVGITQLQLHSGTVAGGAFLVAAGAIYGGTTPSLQGYLWVKESTGDPTAGHMMYRIQLPPVGNTTSLVSTATAIAMSGVPTAHAFTDFAFVGDTLYSAVRRVNSSPAIIDFVSINPTTGAVSVIKADVFGGAVPYNFGAIFGSDTGIYANENGGTGMYHFNHLTGAATVVSDSPGALQNDGANCSGVIVPLSLPVDLSASKTLVPANTTHMAGSSVTYRIVVTNSGPFGAANAQVNDALPPGITTATWVCGSASGGATCGAASGTGDLSGAVVNMPVDVTGATVVPSSLVFTVTMAIPASHTGTLTNTVSVFPPTPSINNESNWANNTATIATTPSVNLSVSKTNGTTTVAAGSTTAYTITFSNLGTSNADGTVGKDTPGPGLSACSVISCSTTGTATCPASGLWPNLLAPSGLTLSPFPALSNIIFRVSCGVTATGT